MLEWEAFQTETIEWQTLIGKAIVAFGEIELVTLKCLAHTPCDHDTDAVAKLRFIERTNLLIKLLTGRNATDTTVVEFVKKLRRAKTLARKRNLIAHNPIMMNVFASVATDDFNFERMIRSARNNGCRLHLVELKQFTAEVSDLAGELWQALHKIIESQQ